MVLKRESGSKKYAFKKYETIEPEYNFLWFSNREYNRYARIEE